MHISDATFHERAIKRMGISIHHPIDHVTRSITAGTVPRSGGVTGSGTCFKAGGPDR
jgi:hypothetical protein